MRFYVGEGYDQIAIPVFLEVVRNCATTSCVGKGPSPPAMGGYYHCWSNSYGMPYVQLKPLVLWSSRGGCADDVYGNCILTFLTPFLHSLRSRGLYGIVVVVALWGL